MTAFLLVSVYCVCPVLTWGLYFLASHPDVQDKLFAELKSVLDGEHINQHNIKKLKYVTTTLLSFNTADSLVYLTDAGLVLDISLSGTTMFF